MTNEVFGFYFFLKSTFFFFITPQVSACVLWHSSRSLLPLLLFLEQQGVPDSHISSRKGKSLLFSVALMTLPSILHFWAASVCIFPHQTVLRFSVDTVWVSYNVIQFWHYPSGDGMRSPSPTRLPLPSPTSDTNCQSRVSPVPLIGCKLEPGGSHHPHVQCWLEWLLELRETFMFVCWS